MKVAFRADASVQIGTGHIMRCLTLAEELRLQGHGCEFLCRPHTGHLGDLISARGFHVHWLQEPVAGEDSAGQPLLMHSHWLGASWQADASQTLSVLEGMEFDWLVMDHYGLDFRWQSLLNNAVPHLMVIDDLADRHHQCDLLLDQNAIDEVGGNNYEGLINEQCKLLMGPAYALLGREYSVLASLLPSRAGQVARVVIFVGGSDGFQLTELYLDALTAPPFEHLCVDVVLGKNHPAPERVNRMAAARRGTQVHSGLPSLAGLMMRADLMLGGGGATNWERLCLGLPSIVTSIAANQDKVNQVLSRMGLIHFLGKAECVTLGDIRQMVLKILDDPVALAEESGAMRAIVDGKGTSRVVDRMSVVVGRG